MALQQVSEGAMRDFLSDPPFLGQSHYRDRQQVSAAGGRWDPKAKMYAAHGLEALCAMVKTGFWTPSGLDNNRALLLRVAQQMLAERPARVPPAVPAKKPAKCPRRGPDTTAERQSREAFEAEALRQARQHRANREKATRLFAERQLDIPPDAEASLFELENEHAIPRELVHLSSSFPDLGPRSGLSTADRLLRGFRLGDGRICDKMLQRLRDADLCVD